MHNLRVSEVTIPRVFNTKCLDEMQGYADIKSSE